MLIGAGEAVVWALVTLYGLLRLICLLSIDHLPIPKDSPFYIRFLHPSMLYAMMITSKQVSTNTQNEYSCTPKEV